MARKQDKIKAIELRLQGWSYTQLTKELNVGKGTLSAWLKDYPLSHEKIRELRDWNQVRIERYCETRRRTREARLAKICGEQKDRIFPLSKRDLFIAGLFLYWGEGGKTQRGVASVSNTDPSVLNFFIHWLINCFKVPKNRLRATLHLYEDMNKESEIEFWSRTLGLPKDQFHKPYIKKTLFKNITYKNGFGHGTCNVQISNVKIGEQVLMGVRALQNRFMRV